MTQPATPPVQKTPPTYPTTPTTIQQVLINLGATPQMVNASSAPTSITQLWNSLTNSNWSLWFLFRQAPTPNTTENQRLAGCLATMISPFLTSANMPDASVLSGAQTLLSQIQGFSSGSVTAAALEVASKSFQVAKPTQFPPAPAQDAERNLAHAVKSLAHAAISADPATAAGFSNRFSYMMCQFLWRSGQSTDLYPAQATLAAMVKSSVPFQTTLSPA